MLINIYLSGAMEAYDGTNKAKEWRDNARCFFYKYCENVNVINPVDFYSYDSCDYKSDIEVFKFDLRKTKEADIVLVNLNDIRKSVGSIVEIYEAYKNNTPIIGFVNKDLNNDDELKKEIHPWIYICCDRIECGSDSMLKAVNYIKDYYLERNSK